ncbi:MAG: glycoside hydrolase family 3 C-terminal domain-containing protein, partial [Bacteroidetes bacterium]|nr:glycoside hydrolase family 3 C-terminal domain-containing protein [Bacteroidota bacterium]
KNIAVIGPLGDSGKVMLGSWTAAGNWEQCVTLLKGIKNKAGQNVEVLYEKGCNTNDTDQSGFDAALKLARKADFVILALGENGWMSGEAASRTSIDLPGVQNDLAAAIVKTGKPVAVALFNGRPLTITKLNSLPVAILETWFGGTEAGNGIADVLFGDMNPAGKITMTFPENEGQIPIYYNAKNTGRPYNPKEPESRFVSRYLDCSNDPLFPFGYGLSYTSFTYSNLTAFVDSSNINITVEVANSGDRDGEEVVQLYVRDKVGSVTRPLKELKGFRKLLIPKGETKKVEFHLTTEDLAFYHPDLKKYWEPGEFVVSVGTNSSETISKSVFIPDTKDSQEVEFKSNGKVDFPLTPEDEKMLDSIQHKTLLFFLNEHHPEKGIVKDRTAPWAPASIASTGFGIPSFAIGAERKWITREQAAEITLKILTFFINSVQSTDTNVTGYKGFYYHFLRMNSGTREWNCELSSIDTGILMMGIIFARNYYNLDNEIENQIRMLAAILLGRIEWNFLEMPASGKFAHTISMGWSPEGGIHDYGWSGYNEGLFLYVLAAGSGMENVERSYQAWLSSYKWQTPYKGLSHVAFPPLFGHQFSQAFIDYRGIADKYMQEKKIDYFENSRRATYVQRQYAMDNPKNWRGYDSLCWGITASDGPTEKYNFDDKAFKGYAGRGTSGPDYNYFDDGTIAPYGSLSSLPFAPEIVLPTIKSINKKYGKNLWGKYGYFDSFNPTANWFNNDFIGIDEGPMLIMIENFRTGLVWNYVMKDPIIQKGLNKLGYKYLSQ